MIKAKDPYAGADPAWGFLPRPALCANLVGAFDLSQGLERAVVNQAGGAPARVIGTPVAQANAMRFSGGACLETEIFDSEELCIVTVSRIVNEPVNGAIVVGTYLNGTSPGTSVYYTSNKSLRVSADAEAGLVSSSWSLTSSYSEFWINLFSVRYEVDGDRTVINQRGYDDGPSVISPNLNNLGGARVPAARKFRIGDDYSGTFQDAVDISAVFFVRGLGAYDAPTYALKDAFGADVAAWCAVRSISLG